MSVFNIHFIWFLSFALAFLLSSILFLYSAISLSSWSLSFNLYSMWNIDLSVSFYLDWIAMSFISAVLFISIVIMIYSYNYMFPYNKSLYFLWITTLFVISMLLVISISNLLFVILGWDGLGLVSFFLIVYYQNNSSIVSGVFTLLMNRIGDSFFLISLLLLFYSYPDFFSMSSSLSPLVLIVFLILTFMTNSAIFPFSPWLPLAIAAPTPISALVHSSTLVTSGLFLIIRFSYILYSSPILITILLLLSVFTSLYAGLNTVFETDLNNLIALSTLSHLGFIGLAFSAGLLHLSFFHLLTHALFNSLLFITIGDIMINLSHSQDIRFLSNGHIVTPLSSIIMSVSIINLLGLPSISGFFSNDLVLECLNYGNMSFFVIVLVYINVLFTYYYSLNLFYYSFSSINFSPYSLFHSPLLLHSSLLFILALSTLLFSGFFISAICPTLAFVSIPVTLKFLPLTLIVIILSYLFIYTVLPTVNNKFVYSFFSSILFLSNIIISFAPSLYYNYIFPHFVSIEPRFMSILMHSSSFPYFTFVYTHILHTITNPQRSLYLSSVISLVLLVFFLLA